MKTQPMVYVRRAKDIPQEPHFAVFVDESFRYDDGYGERGQPSFSTHESVQYIAFFDEEELKIWLLRQDTNSAAFKAVKVTPLVVTRHVTVDVR